MSKGKSFEALKAEIAQLEVEAAAARRIEIKEAVSSIRGTIQKYGLTAADLGFKGQSLPAPRGKASTSRPGAGVARYLEPKSGKTWTGAGKPPGWIASAKNRDIYLIQPEMAKASPATSSTPAKKGSPGGSKPAVKGVAKPVVTAAAKPATKPVAKPVVKATAKATKPVAKPAAKPAAKVPAKSAMKPAAKAPAKAASKQAAKPAPNARPKIAVRKVEPTARPFQRISGGGTETPGAVKAEPSVSGSSPSATS